MENEFTSCAATMGIDGLTPADRFFGPCLILLDTEGCCHRALRGGGGGADTPGSSPQSPRAHRLSALRGGAAVTLQAAVQLGAMDAELVGDTGRQARVC
jgi:hypothetical protein